MAQITIGGRSIGDASPTYFVADISANHDGSLERARLLIRLAAVAGADAAKFQNFRAPAIVSRRGFADLGGQFSHQSRWKKSVYEVYEEAALPWEWTAALRAECDSAGIDYFSTPYDFEAVDMLDPYVKMFKIGSGDITWLEMLRHVAGKGKPVLLATGAANIGDVQRAVHAIGEINPHIVLMHFYFNYTATTENFAHIHLNVLKTYHAMFPSIVLGLSDHTSGHATVLGAVTLGARVVEKHLTDDTTREGPDHPFSMTPANWREMVDRTRELEHALGSGDKTVAGNERETVVIQRRCLRASRDLSTDTVLTRDMIDVLRPAPADAIFPFEINRVVGMRLLVNLEEGDSLRWPMLGARN